MKSFKTIIGVVLLVPTFLGANCAKQTKEADNNNANGGNDKYKLELAFPQLPAVKNLVELTSPNDGTNRIFVVNQEGIIYEFDNRADVKNPVEFLNISSRVASGGEMGLLGLAFHPDYKTNGYFYVNYTRQKGDRETVISRFKVNASNQNIADAASEEVLLTYKQPYSNHNGGKLAFGNDGLLYIAVGDGGSGGDPLGNGQNKATLLGKILRIDVNKAEADKKYAIPGDNPFKGNDQGFKEEIYAFGMRNPWRFSFDKTTGMLWAGDVGQNKLEEIDIVEKGGNFGWNTMEAGECFGKDGCDKTGMSVPIWSYGRSDGGSITGGYVCRDKNLEGLTGKYIYGDYLSGKIWALNYSGNKAVSNDLLADVGSGALSSFGEDSNNNLYILNYRDGKIYKFATE